jgi:hypothetical protein
MKSKSISTYYDKHLDKVIRYIAKRENQPVATIIKSSIVETFEKWQNPNEAERMIDQYLVAKASDILEKIKTFKQEV